MVWIMRGEAIFPAASSVRWPGLIGGSARATSHGDSRGRAGVAGDAGDFREGRRWRLLGCDDHEPASLRTGASPRAPHPPRADLQRPGPVAQRRRVMLPSRARCASRGERRPHGANCCSPSSCVRVLRVPSPARLRPGATPSTPTWAGHARACTPVWLLGFMLLSGLANLSTSSGSGVRASVRNLLAVWSSWQALQPRRLLGGLRARAVLRRTDHRAGASTSHILGYDENVFRLRRAVGDPDRRAARAARRGRGPGRPMQRVEVPVLVVGAGPVGLTASACCSPGGASRTSSSTAATGRTARRRQRRSPRTLEICRARWRRRRRGCTPCGHTAGGRLTRRVGDDARRRELGRRLRAAGRREPPLHADAPALNLSQHRFEPDPARPAARANGRGPLSPPVGVRSSGDADGVTSPRRRPRRRAELRRCAARCLARRRRRRQPRAPGARHRDDRPGPAPELRHDPFPGRTCAPLVRGASGRSSTGSARSRLSWALSWRTTSTARWVFMHAVTIPTRHGPPTRRTRPTSAPRSCGARSGARRASRSSSATSAPWTMTVAGRGCATGAGRVFLSATARIASRRPASSGMNTGIRDAHNLVWKLARRRGRLGPAVAPRHLRGRAPPRSRRSNADRSLTNAAEDAWEEAVQALRHPPRRSCRLAVRGMQAALAGPIRPRTALRARRDRRSSQQREHFDMFFRPAAGLQLQEAARSAPTARRRPRARTRYARTSRPTTRPLVARVPHACRQERAGRRCVSALDLLPYDGFRAAGRAPGRTADAGGRLRSPRSAGRRSAVSRSPDGTSRILRGHWASVCGIGAGGAVSCARSRVAWRARSAPGDLRARSRRRARPQSRLRPSIQPRPIAATRGRNGRSTETIAQFAPKMLQRRVDRWLEAGAHFAEKKKFEPDVLAHSRLAPDQYELDAPGAVRVRRREVRRRLSLGQTGAVASGHREDDRRARARASRPACSTSRA